MEHGGTLLERLFGRICEILPYYLGIDGNITFNKHTSGQSQHEFSTNLHKVLKAKKLKTLTDNIEKVKRIRKFP